MNKEIKALIEKTKAHIKDLDRGKILCKRTEQLRDIAERINDLSTKDKKNMAAECLKISEEIEAIQNRCSVRQASIKNNFNFNKN